MASGYDDDDDKQTSLAFFFPVFALGFALILWTWFPTRAPVHAHMWRCEFCTANTQQDREYIRLRRPLHEEISAAKCQRGTPSVL